MDQACYYHQEIAQTEHFAHLDLGVGVIFLIE